MERDLHEARSQAIADSKIVWDRTVPLEVEYMANATQFSSLVVRSAFLLNGGALVIFPTFLAALKDNPESIDEKLVMTAALFLIVGILFAAFCSWLAYMNYNWTVHRVSYERGRDLLLIDEYHDVATFHSKRDYRDRTLLWYKERLVRNSRLTEWSFYVSNVSGIFSYLFFFIGAYYSGRSIFAAV